MEQTTNCNTLFSVVIDIEYEDGVPYTGDEIHFTDGTIWSCLWWSSLRPISPEADCVVFIPMSFKNWLNDEFVSDPYFADEVRPLLTDALKGGAKIVRGVGLAKDN
jgi:hypothetical protein